MLAEPVCGSRTDGSCTPTVARSVNTSIRERTGMKQPAHASLTFGGCVTCSSAHSSTSKSATVSVSSAGLHEVHKICASTACAFETGIFVLDTGTSARCPAPGGQVCASESHTLSD